MCLIAVSKDGTPVTRETFDLADHANPDGIGIMTSEGFAKFLGPKRRRKAWKYLERHVYAHGLPFAMHFRWTTHGENTRANTHPHLTPDGRFLVMHNGVMAEFDDKTGVRSDTALFVEQMMDDLPDPADVAQWPLMVAEIEQYIGSGNKLAVLHIASGTFHIMNKRCGDFGTDGIWYSNTYSLPSSIDPYSRWTNTRRHVYDGDYTTGGVYAPRAKVRYADALDRWLEKNKYSALASSGPSVTLAPGDLGLPINAADDSVGDDWCDAGYTPERMRREEAEAAEALDTCYLYASR